MTPATEIRRHRRYPVRKIVSCQNGGRKFLALTVNLSLGGMKIEAPHPLDTNQHLRSVLVLDRKPILAEGRVVYSYSDIRSQVSTGIEFVEIAQDDRKALKVFLMKQKKSLQRKQPLFKDVASPLPDTRKDKPREQLIEELSALRNRLVELEWERKESRRAFQALDETEERFQELAELLPMGVAEYDLDMNLRYANRFLYEMFGYTEEDFKRRPDVSQALAPEELQRPRKAIRRIASGEPVGSGEYRMVRKGGERLYGEVHSVAIVREGTVVGIRSVVQDITNRKRAEVALHKSHRNLEAEIEKRTLELTKADQELRQSQKAFRRLFESDIIGITLGDLERIYDANDAFLKMVGYGREDLLSGGIYWREITPPEHSHRDEQALEEIATRGSSTPFEKEYIRKDGSRVPILIGATVVEESPLNWIGFVLDITGRKRAELHTQFLNQLHPVLMQERNPAELVQRALRALAGHLGVDLAAFGDLRPDGTIIVEKEYRDGRPSVLNTYRVADFLTDEAQEALLAGTGLIVHDVATDPRTAVHLDGFRRIEIAAFVGEPLVTPEGPKAFIGVVSRRPRVWRPDEAQLLRNVAARLFPAVERARTEKALHQRTFELQQLTQTLEHRVQERTEDLEKANEASRQLSSRLLSAQEDERRRTARELHDSIGSSLVTIKNELSRKLKQIGDGTPPPGTSLEEIMASVTYAIGECRRVQRDVRPAILDDIGLIATINWHCREFGKDCPDIRIEKQIEAEEKEIPESLKIVIYRILQEGLNNIRKYSQADWVRLRLSKSDEAFEMCIQDNGQGFDLGKIELQGDAKGMGLESMRERVELSGGSFYIESGKRKGTAIRAVWPCKDGVLIIYGG